MPPHIQAFIEKERREFTENILDFLVSQMAWEKFQSERPILDIAKPSPLQDIAKKKYDELKSLLESSLKAMYQNTLEVVEEEMPEMIEIDEEEHKKRKFNEECVCDICDRIARNACLSEVKFRLGTLKDNQK